MCRLDSCFGGVIAMLRDRLELLELKLGEKCVAGSEELAGGDAVELGSEEVRW